MCSVALPSLVGMYVGKDGVVDGAPLFSLFIVVLG